MLHLLNKNTLATKKFIIFSLILTTVLSPSCKKEQEEESALLKNKDLILGIWTYKQTEHGTANYVTNLSSAGEYIKFNADNTFEINASYVFDRLPSEVNSLGFLPNGRYAISEVNDNVISLFGNGLSDPQNPNSSVVQNAWTGGFTIWQISDKKLVFKHSKKNQSNEIVPYNSYFEK